MVFSADVKIQWGKVNILWEEKVSENIRFRAITWNHRKFQYCYANRNLLSIFLTCI